MNFEKFVDFADRLADQAREIAMTHFRTRLDVEEKSDNTPVSIADKRIETTLRDIINSVYPNHGILGEEYEKQHSNSEFLWVIDPIDGTKSFITGRPTFGCLIALLYNGSPVLGIIEMPALKERWTGVRHRNAFFNDIKVHTSGTRKLSDAVTACTGIDFFTDTELPVFDHLSSQGKFRLFGGDCYNYGLLASGYVDIVIESDLKPFDYMALIPVIESAGGVVTDWQGKKLSLESVGQVLACSSESLHQACLNEISMVNPPCPETP